MGKTPLPFLSIILSIICPSLCCQIGELVVVDGEVLEEEDQEDANGCIEDIEYGGFRGDKVDTVDIVDKGEDKGTKYHFTLLITGEHLSIDYYYYYYSIVIFYFDRSRIRESRERYQSENNILTSR